jgi:hypothetical protein
MDVNLAHPTDCHDRQIIIGFCPVQETRKIAAAGGEEFSQGELLCVLKCVPDPVLPVFCPASMCLGPSIGVEQQSLTRAHAKFALAEGSSTHHAEW